MTGAPPLPGTRSESDRFQEAMRAARRGNHAEAEELARRLRAVTTDQTLLVRLANLLGGIAFERGRLDEARGWLDAVVVGAPDTAEPLLAARATNNLASIAHLRGERELAVGLYRSALAAWEHVGDATGVAQCCHNLGIVAGEAGAESEALGYADRAVEAARITTDLALLGLVLLGRAERRLSAGALPSARADLAEAAELARGAGDSLGIAEADRLAGLVALAEGRPEEALRLARFAYRRANLLGATLLAADCAELCARAEAVRGL